MISKWLFDHSNSVFSWAPNRPFSSFNKIAIKLTHFIKTSRFRARELFSCFFVFWFLCFWPLVVSLKARFGMKSASALVCLLGSLGVQGQVVESNIPIVVIRTETVMPSCCPNEPGGCCQSKSCGMPECIITKEIDVNGTVTIYTEGTLNGPTEMYNGTFSVHGQSTATVFPKQAYNFQPVSQLGELVLSFQLQTCQTMVDNLRQCGFWHKRGCTGAARERQVDVQGPLCWPDLDARLACFRHVCSNGEVTLDLFFHFFLTIIFCSTSLG